ncbi:hypothetical protein ABPG74_002885 [Tetrahymena malaccensis]
MITVEPQTNKTCEETSSIETQSLDKNNEVKQKIIARQKVTCYKNRKFLYASISIGIILCIAAVAIFCAIYFKDHSKIEGKIVKSGSAQIQGQEIKYHQYDIDVTYKDSTQSKLTLFQTQSKHAVQTKDSQGQNVNKEINATCYSAKIEGSNQSYRFCNHSQDNEDKSFEYETFLDASHLLDDIKNENQDPNLRNLQGETLSSQQFKVSLENGEIVIQNDSIDALNEDLKAEGLFIQTQLLLNAETTNQKEIIHDNQSNSFSIKTSNLENPNTIDDSNSQIHQNNDAYNKRMLRWRIKKVFKSIVNAVKVAGPIIGAVVGGVIGLAGGPAGVLAGAELGFQIGSISSSVAKSCLPENSQGNVIFKCDPKTAGREALKLAVSSVAASYVPKEVKDEIRQISLNVIKKVY